MRAQLSLRPRLNEEVLAYLQHYPEEAERLAPLTEQLLAVGEAPLLPRTARPGHVVASGLVLDARARKLLVIHHRVMLARIPPGGHYEGTGTLRGTAAREVEEETGYAGAVSLALPSTGSFLLDVFPHETPGTVAKGEGPHWHYDFLYLFRGDSTRTLTPQLEEVSEADWAPVEEYFSGSARGALVGSKLRELV